MNEVYPMSRKDQHDWSFNSLTPEEYPYRQGEIITYYSEYPEEFQKDLFEALPKINPKVLRMILYQLYLRKITLNDLLELRQIGSPPSFLYQLDDFPLESILVLLKYNFPHMINGHLFFAYSLDRVNVISTPNVPEPSNLDWFDFSLSLCELLNIDINVLNSKGKTTLSEAIQRGDLYTIQLLLKHRANPSIENSDDSTPLSLAIKEIVDGSLISQRYLYIVRELVRYGARSNRSITKMIDQSDHEQKITQFILSGDQLQPNYFSLNKPYFNLDISEDLALIAMNNPNIINDKYYQEELGKVNLNLFEKAVHTNRAQTKLTDNYILTWPYYIDETVIPTYAVSVDQRPTVDSPPNPTQVYKNALTSIPNRDFQKTPPPLIMNIEEQPEPWSHALYEIPSPPLTPTFPLVPKQPLFNHEE
jgi:hypothetical protein